MRKIVLPLIFLLIILLFIFISNSIITVKLQELRFQISKEQLLNYELSSNLLREKFRQMLLSRDDYTNEIKLNITESEILNSRLTEARIQSSNNDFVFFIKEKSGMLIINIVRFLNLKSALKLSDDQKDLLKLQFSFYLERTRKFPLASKKYLELEEKFPKESSDYAFTLLHNGFCLALAGQTEEALVKLHQTEVLFPNTHFGENAKILIALLLEGKKRSDKIDETNDNDRAKATALYRVGQYKKALELFDKVPDRIKREDFMRARSMEEIGKTASAVQEYIKLVRQKEDKDTAIQANRRLLMIGSIYEKNKELTDYSKENAQKMGDLEIVKQVEEGSKLIKKAVIIEKLEQLEQNTNTEEGRELAELKKELESIQTSTKKEMKESVREVAEVRKEEEKEPSPPPEEEPVEEEIGPEMKQNFQKEFEVTQDEVKGQLKIKLVDGRNLLGRSLEFRAEKAIIKTAFYETILPENMIDTIIVESGSFFSNSRFKLETNDGQVFPATKATKKGNEITIKSQDGEIEVPIRRVRRLTLQ
ncbi:MAG: hypothetical protein H7A23_02660 [Leptospiraceae bacterium]|nr:hypothetical protein [Leptospiraceae bacterium]MCP5493433.1 hypothetical protein [Leptospiraceae bacterium]